MQGPSALSRKNTHPFSLLCIVHSVTLLLQVPQEVKAGKDSERRREGALGHGGVQEATSRERASFLGEAVQCHRDRTSPSFLVKYGPMRDLCNHKFQVLPHEAEYEIAMSRLLHSLIVRGPAGIRAQSPLRINGPPLGRDSLKQYSVPLLIVHIQLVQETPSCIKGEKKVPSGKSSSSNDRPRHSQYRVAVFQREGRTASPRPGVK
jgi:hypothetical protein